MSRKYFRYTGAQLQELFNSSKDDPQVLKELHEELKFRKTPKMVALREKVESHLSKVPPSPSSSIKKILPEVINPQEKAPDPSKAGEFEHPAKKDMPNDSSGTQAKDVELSKIFKKISSKGSVPNRPEKWVPNLKTTMKLGVNFDAPLVSIYRAGLTNLISEMKKRVLEKKRFI